MNELFTIEAFQCQSHYVSDNATNVKCGVGVNWCINCTKTCWEYSKSKYGVDIPQVHSPPCKRTNYDVYLIISLILTRGFPVSSPLEIQIKDTDTWYELRLVHKLAHDTQSDSLNLVRFNGLDANKHDQWYWEFHRSWYSGRCNWC